MEKKISCIILAAGKGERFGGDKLLAPVRGVPMISRAFQAVPKEAFHQVAVVSGEERILELAGQEGFVPVENAFPEQGISRSIRLGIRALESCDAILFMVSDQPFLKKESILQILDKYAENPDCIIALAHKGESGNPVLFPREYFQELEALQGDKGGKTVMKRYPLRQRLVEVPEEQLLDVDTKEMLGRLKDLK